MTRAIAQMRLTKVEEQRWKRELELLPQKGETARLHQAVSRHGKPLMKTESRLYQRICQAVKAKVMPQKK